VDLMFASDYDALGDVTDPFGGVRKLRELVSMSHLVTPGSHLQIMLRHADLNEDSFALRDQVLAVRTGGPRATRGRPASIW
jgi:hypothetical protein